LKASQTFVGDLSAFLLFAAAGGAAGNLPREGAYGGQNTQ
jgi:hypothetical protein